MDPNKTMMQNGINYPNDLDPFLVNILDKARSGERKIKITYEKGQEQIGYIVASMTSPRKFPMVSPRSDGGSGNLLGAKIFQVSDANCNRVLWRNGN